MTVRLAPHTSELLRRRDVRLRQRATPESKARFGADDIPTEPQRAALVAARDGGGALTRQRHGHWINSAGGTHLTYTVDACRRRGWLTDAPGYERAMKPSWTPVVITDAGRKVIGEGE